MDSRSKKVQKFLPLISKVAWQTWHRLPPQTRAWIDPEDLIEEGILLARYHVIPRHDPSRASFSTFIYQCLHAHFKTLTDYYFMQKRFQGRDIPLQSISYPLGRRLEVPFEQHVVSAQLFEKLISLASPELRRYLYAVYVSGHERVSSLGRKSSKNLLSEFQYLSQVCSFTGGDSSALIRSKAWMSHVDWSHLSYLVK